MQKVTEASNEIDGPSSSKLHHLPPSAIRNVADASMARQFFDGSGMSRPDFQRAISMNMHQANSELNQLQPQFPIANIPNFESLAWARNSASSAPPQLQHLQKSQWSEEFGQSVPQNVAPQMSQSELHVSTFRPMSHGGVYIPILNSNMDVLSTRQINWDEEFSRVDVKGKGKATEVDLEEAFNRAAALAPKEQSRIVEIKDDNESLEAAFERTTINDGTVLPEDKEKSEFERIWDQLQNSELPPATEDMAKWEAEFNDLMQSQRDDLEFANNMETAWKDSVNSEQTAQRFDEDGIPILEPYQFEADNPFMDQPISHLTQAKQLLERNGSLTEVALLLEAAIQKGELGQGDYEAWVLLGEVRSMDEREDQAMRALTEGVRRSQESGQSGEGMISLAISYTNESFERASHATLLRWLIAKYGQSLPDEFKGSLPKAPWASLQQATDAFLTIARQQHGRGELDPDVQIGLGVLFYTNAEFDKAKDCFEAALSARPQDYLLWNRLGSCLSNGSKPEEALGVYREALRLHPTYTRAIYNVGVACLNIGAYKEAAEHFLTALSMQESAASEKSEQLWHTLRKCLLSMGRHDLAEAAKPGQLLDRFKNEGASVRRYASSLHTNTLVYLEHHNGELDHGSLSALTAARELGGNVTGLVLSKPEFISDIIEKAKKLKGLNTLLHASSPLYTPPLPEAVAPLIRELLSSSSFSHVVSAHSSSARGILPRVAATMDLPAISDVISFTHDSSSNSTTFIRPIYAGNALTSVRAPESVPIKIFSIRATSFKAAEYGGEAAEVRSVDAVEVPDIPSRHIKTEVTKSDRPDLGSASRVISGGRALKDAETFQKILYPLADLLGAAVGASRAAVDAGYADNSLQVGQTGKVVAPELYMAIGISGAIQHLAGMKDSKMIVAINKDSDAPIFQVADLGLVADLYEVVPDLINKLK
ncbi:hypothetical protein Clacol_000432 [Clathrus columnatus]|uniref:Probable electron transfer flavoprotein subunit alpha, mitochondrial n=1 Tax=Clathrus columnatus TaxID=1419009 RepID=A0AAV4ZWI9_9AGAM|nr:hypothetical protein Clacol_000432 [Clathrus columnatus]